MFSDRLLGTDRAGKQPHGLFLKIAASRFSVLHAAAQHVVLPEGKDRAGSATPGANSPAACTCQRIATSGIVPVH
jgi:hypothetical protein